MTAASTVTDEAVEAAERAYMERWRDRVPAPGAGMRAALEAAVPLLAPQPVADQEALSRAISDELDAEGIVSCGLTPKLVDVVAHLDRPLLDREAVKSAVGDTINRRIEFIEDRATVEAAYDAAASAVMDLARPMPRWEQIEQRIRRIYIDGGAHITHAQEAAAEIADAVLALINGTAK